MQHHGGVLAVGRRVASASQPVSTRRINASIVLGSGGQFSDPRSPWSCFHSAISASR
ncbi:hypothetical protein I553_6972 [Mycobacterium xenopi 4042]|uniref:Uncharacterized protein n=1 Tax=Mycobacterium xenopi 4042 TaxID=1299334 RepID=X7Z517_MYCXE|nr:hypothetical protein I553_6972 [Mycobacterium xenopi 4042]